ncbi:DUF6049 family protein [Nakamurella leprariae]|uniref:Glycoprotein n=1 Tax=Nakamurella leprariae TaxID=2803911 RepID=A0A939C329_9ACTN|nr:DUF6049 family protein [Nakamurella leprariae]MBM9468954.1 hypothetical protein [Nakamurella leprariae]
MGRARRVTAAPATTPPASTRAPRPRPAVRLLLALVAACVAALVTVVPAVGPAVAAVPGPGTAAVGARAAAIPEGYAGTVTFDVTSIDPTVVTGPGPAVLTVTGTMTNTGELPIDGLVSRFQRGPAVDADALIERLDDPLVPSDVVAGTFTDLVERLEPGATSPFTVSVPLTETAPGGDRGSLELTDAGVYPVMLNVNGTLVSPDGDVPARVGELHLWLTVAAPPSAGEPPAGPGGGTNTTSGSADAQPVAVLWPLADRPHLGTAGVFADDDLLDEIRPGGRLDAALTALLPAGGDATLPADLVTVLLDPMLVDELDRMSRGYRVLVPGAGQPAVDPVAAAAREPEATTTDQVPGTSPGAPSGTAPADPELPDGAPDLAQDLDDTDLEAAVAAQLAGTTTPGAGQAVATQFLDRLRRVVAQRPTVLLPYGDPDVVGLVGVGATAVLDDAVERGRRVTDRVLGPLRGAAGAPTVPGPDGPGPAVDGIAVPPDGRLDAAAATALVGVGTRAVVLDPDAVPEPRGTDGLVLDVAGTDGETVRVPALLTDPGLLPSTDRLRAAGRPAGFAARTNTTAALLAEPGTGSGGAVAVLAPTAQGWDATPAELTGFARTLAALAAADLVTGVDLPTALDLATGEPDAPTAGLPGQVPAVLPADLLERVTAAHDAIGLLRSVLLAPVEPGESDPAPLLDVLDDAVTSAASSALAADPEPGRELLDTVAATTDGVQAAVTIPSAGSYTLASASSPLLLTVRNALPYRVQLSVAIRGGAFAGLTVTDPGVQTMLAGRSLQISIPAEVARSGTFPVTAALVSPSGQAWGAGEPLSVTSRAYGAFTLIVVGVAGSVLLLMVIWRIRQRWQARRLRTAGGESADPGPGLPPGDGPGSQPDQREPAELPTASTER